MHTFRDPVVSACHLTMIGVPSARDAATVTDGVPSGSDAEKSATVAYAFVCCWGTFSRLSLLDTDVVEALPPITTELGGVVL